MNTDSLIGTIVHCVVCSKDETLHWNEHCNAKLTLLHQCFNCNFWSEKVEWAHFGDEHYELAVRVNGQHFLISEDPKPGQNGFFGYGGSAFYIHFHGGRKVISRNVWHQGDIPEHFKHLLPDNAVFVTKESF